MENPLDTLDKLAEKAQWYIDLFKPQWKARANAIRTLLSLSSTALVISITFATSVIKPWSPPLWRWGIITSWIMLTVSLFLSLAALWFSINLEDLPLMIMSKHKELCAAITAAQSTSFDETDISRIFNDATQQTSRKNKYSERFSLAALVTFGVALLVFTITGVFLAAS